MAYFYEDPYTQQSKQLWGQTRGPATYQPQNAPLYAAQEAKQAGQVKGVSTGGVGLGAAPAQAPAQAPAPTEQPGYYMTPPEGGGTDWEGMARSGYESLMGGLNAIEEAYRAEYPVTQKEITTGYEQAKPGLEEARTTQLGEQQTRRIAEQGRETGAISQARSLYNQLRQQRMAELSAGGLTSSSVAEAQMERLGREAYGDIGTARKQAAETYRQIEAEETKVSDFYNRQLTELEQNKSMALEKARVSFNSGLAQIAQMKGKAGAEFQMQQAQMRYDAMQQLRQESLQIQQYNSQMRVDLEKWATQKQQAFDASKQQIGSSIPMMPYDFGGLEMAKGYGITGVSPKQMGGSWYGVPTYGKAEEEGMSEEERKAMEAAGIKF